MFAIDKDSAILKKDGERYIIGSTFHQEDVSISLDKPLYVEGFITCNGVLSSNVDIYAETIFAKKSIVVQGSIRAGGDICARDIIAKGHLATAKNIIASGCIDVGDYIEFGEEIRAKSLKMPKNGIRVSIYRNL